MSDHTEGSRTSKSAPPSRRFVREPRLHSPPRWQLRTVTPLGPVSRRKADPAALANVEALDDLGEEALEGDGLLLFLLDSRAALAPRTLTLSPRVGGEGRSAGGSKAPPSFHPRGLEVCHPRAAELPVGVFPVIGRCQEHDALFVIDLVEDSPDADPDSPRRRVPVLEAGG